MIKPLFKNILVEPIINNTTEGGIILSNTQEKKPIGVIVAIGDDVTSLKTGDKIIYGKYDGTPIEYNKIKLLLMQEESVFAIIE